MPLPPTALLNGKFYSHASYKFRVFGLLVPQIKECNWKVSVERGDVPGMARETLATTQGTVKYEFSFTTYRPIWDALKERASAALGSKIMDAEGDIVLSMADRGMPTKTIQVHVWGLSEADNTSSAGVDATETKVTCKVAFIKEDGQALVENSVW